VIDFNQYLPRENRLPIPLPEARVVDSFFAVTRAPALNISLLARRALSLGDGNVAQLNASVVKQSLAVFQGENNCLA
jgi:hypothetical protein